jgi:hypothetical protein
MAGHHKKTSKHNSSITQKEKQILKAGSHSTPHAQVLAYPN